MTDPVVLNIGTIRERIRSACERSGRVPNEVRLLLATKTVPANRIKVALETGVTLIGENKIQELKEKFQILKGIPHTNHFIGHLQTNKIRDLLKYDVSCVQSLDRLELATKLSERLEVEKKNLDVLIQVNTSDEVSKFGIHPGIAIEFIERVSRLKNLNIKGLMTIGLLSADTPKVRACFRLLRQVQQRVIEANSPDVQMTELSMGMSGDLEIAVEEGATIVRVGTAIFGRRPTPDSYYWNEHQ